jgi:hypothetical protein
MTLQHSNEHCEKPDIYIYIYTAFYLTIKGCTGHLQHTGTDGTVRAGGTGEISLVGFCREGDKTSHEVITAVLLKIQVFLDANANFPRERTLLRSIQTKKKAIPLHRGGQTVDCGRFLASLSKLFGASV